MPSEIKTSKFKVETAVSENLRKQFKKHCKKLNVSVAQRIRDLMQKDIKA